MAINYLCLWWVQLLLSIEEAPTAFRQYYKREWGARNRDRINSGRRIRYAWDSLKRRNQNEKWNRENPGRGRIAVEIWRLKNRARVNKNQRNARARRIKSGTEERLLGALRSRVWAAIQNGKGAKSARTLQLVGAPIQVVWDYLSKQFKSGMTRENYGAVWEIDHIRPCASFDLTDPVQQRQCFHYSNLQPLLVSENRSKGAKWNG